MSNRLIVLIFAVIAALLVVVAMWPQPSYGNECGKASWYGIEHHGRKTASGKKFNRNAMTAAHKTLPFGTVVRVTDRQTGKSVSVTINDRGPFVRGRVIDLSEAAAARLGTKGRGVAGVCLAW